MIHVPTDWRSSAYGFLFQRNDGPRVTLYRQPGRAVANAKFHAFTLDDFVKADPADFTEAAVISSSTGDVVGTFQLGTGETQAEPPPVKPTADDFDDLPDQMVRARRWLVWKSKSNPDPTKKPKKTPFYTSGRPRSGELDAPEDIAYLATFNDALKALQTGQYAGLGFALGPDDNGQCWQGIDLDDLPNRPELQDIADTLPGYTEKSPSGTGMHAVGYGRQFPPLGSNGTGIEAYSAGRFFTVTADSAGLHGPCDLSGFVDTQLRPAHARGKAGQPSADGERTETIEPKTVTELRSALLSIPSDHRDVWIRMGHALKELGHLGRGLWLEWSATSDKFDSADASKVWRSFKPNNTGYQAVFAEAQRQGWVNPLSNTATGGAQADSRTQPDEPVSRITPLPHISEVAIWRPDEGAEVPDGLKCLPNPFLHCISEVISRSAETTDRALNIAGVIHLAAVTVARAVVTNKRNCAVLYLCNVARSGAGKNSAKNFVARCLGRAFGMNVISNFSSGTGLFSALRKNPASVMHLDEFGDKLVHGLKDRAGSHVAKGFSDMKEIFSQADDQLSPATFSTIGQSQRNREDFLKNIAPIHKPHLNLLAVTTPGQLNDAVTQASVEGGLINRFVFVSASGNIVENEDFDPVPPDWLIGHMRQARGCGAAGNLAEIPLMLEDPDAEPPMRQYSFCDWSMADLQRFKEEIKRLGANDEFMADMSQRWRENAMRMALALHAFSTPEAFTIDPAITRWCIHYVRFYGRQFALRLLELATPTENYGKRRKEYLQAFRRKPDGVSTHDMGKLAPWRNDPVKLRTAIVDDMVNAGDIALVMGNKPARGPAPRVYVALAA